MSGPLERVRQLLELAARSPYVEEARNGAVEAARLIKEHGFVIVEAVVEEVNRGERKPRPTASGFRPEASTLDLEKLGRTVARGVGKGVGKAVERGIGDLLRGRRR